VVIKHSIPIVGGFRPSSILRCKTMRLSAWESLKKYLQSQTGNQSERTYLVEETFGIVSPSNGREFDEANLLRKPCRMVIVRLSINRGERFACAAHINRIEIASLLDVIITSHSNYI